MKGNLTKSVEKQKILQSYRCLECREGIKDLASYNTIFMLDQETVARGDPSSIMQSSYSEPIFNLN